MSDVIRGWVFGVVNKLQCIVQIKYSSKVGHVRRGNKTVQVGGKFMCSASKILLW